MGGFAAWLAQTPLSAAIGAHDWVTPAVQTVHILALAVLMGAVLMTSLNVLGLLNLDRSLSQLSAQFSSWFYAALLVLLASGAILIAGEPVRALENPIFYLKMGLLLMALALTVGIHAPLRADAGFWAPAGRQIAVRATAGVALLLWASIIFAGRWIAYAGA